MVAHFSRLLRHAMGYIGTILIPGHHTGMQGRLQLQTVAWIYVHLFFTADRTDRKKKSLSDARTDFIAPKNKFIYNIKQIYIIYYYYWPADHAGSK